MSDEKAKQVLDIMTGKVYANRDEAYNVGCMGRPMCFLLMQNEFSDQETKEFFDPRFYPFKKMW